ncbi:MAG: J domain-containing protein [Planctomycetes bacterium]|nr:J domain-containing protein [Planctomycetota bacterium]
MPGGKDFYQALGVPENAGEDQIKRAYRRLAKELHPDRTRGDRAKERRFKEVSEAYEVLSDKEKRAKYDQFRKYGFSGGPGGGASFEEIIGRGAPGGGAGGVGGFGSIFEQFFGGAAGAGGRGPAGPAQGDDVRYVLTIPFELSLKGGKSRISAGRRLQCRECRGSGAAAGSRPRKCADCGGAGYMTVNQGFFATSAPCPRCRGEGEVIDKPCPECGGVGAKATVSKIEVTIPEGIATGQTIRLASQGDAGVRGGPPGDLLIEVRVQEKAGFQRRGLDVESSVEVPVETAILGGKVETAGVEGGVAVSIPAGVQPGTVLRLRGRGMSRGSQKGDHLVTVRVRIPRQLTAEQRALIEKFAGKA